jgi:putative ABC transport system ATP-binding protein
LQFSASSQLASLQVPQLQLNQPGFSVPEIVAEGLQLGFGNGAARNYALRGIDLIVRPKEFTMITGPSGSGKTSLLMLLGGLLIPDKGRVLVGGTDLAALRDNGRARFRLEQVGFIFQAFRLLEALNAQENIRMSLEMRGVSNSRELALSALSKVGLEGRARLKPAQLSGGEKQRVAIARALAHNPSFILADEPTASLDGENSIRVGELLMELAVRPSCSLVVVSHGDRLARFAERIVRMEDGLISKDRQC